MPNELIADKTQIVTPGQPTQSAVLRSNATQEYLVSSVEYGWNNYARSLPAYIDDVTALLGNDLYDRMSLDACVASCINTVVDGIYNEGLTISPAVGEKDEAYKYALELSDFSNRMMDNLETDAEQSLRDISRALIFGNRVAEKVYEVQGNSLVIKALKVKPRNAFGFVVDAYNNVIGLVGQQANTFGGYGSGAYGIGGYGYVDLKTLADANNGETPVLLSRKRFAILTHGMQDNDPRGNSMLRPAYEAWYFKTQMWPEMLKYLAQFAGPSLIALMDAVIAVGGDYIRDQVGNPIVDSAGNMQTESAAQAAYNVLSQVRNGSAAVLPGVASLSVLQSQGNGEAFHNAFQLFDQQMSVAITGQSLSSMEGRHGATSAGASVHQDVLTKRINSNKRLVASFVRREILRHCLWLNFGDKAMPYVPKTSLIAPEEQDKAAMWTALAALETSGYPDPSQYEELDKENGLPVRSPESIQMAIRQKQLGVQTAQAGLEAEKNPQPQIAGGQGKSNDVG